MTDDVDRLRKENLALREQLAAASQLMPALIEMTSAAMIVMLNAEAALRASHPDIAATAEAALAQWRDLLGNFEAAKKLNRSTNVVVPDSQRPN